MAYSEIRCWFCAVSFNTSRGRRLDEPPEAEITSSAGGYWGWDICPPASSCHGILRSIPFSLDTRHREIETGDSHGGGDDSEDLDFAPDSDSESEIYEYESDDDLVSDDCDESEAGKSNLQGERDDPELSGYQHWLQEVAKMTYGKGPLLSTEAIGEIIGNDSSAWNKYEHIPGPRCESGSMYNGHHISFDEMKHNNTFQCLLRKNDDWQSESDDEEFECNGQYFLSGLGCDPPSTDMDSPSVYPERHDIGSVDPFSFDYDGDGGPDYKGMFFHPSCFEVFKYISRQGNGYFDVDKLMKAYWNPPPNLWDHRDHDYNSDLKRCAQQMWNHANGTEWLVANPVHVPLEEIFKLATLDQNVDLNAGAFPKRHHTNQTASNDPFRQLPCEITYQIISYLPSKDIASLRLASREFEQLPLSLFYHLIRDEMPWLWEAWSDEQPSMWTTTSMSEFKNRDQEEAKFEEELAHYREQIKKEMPEVYKAWVAAEPTFNEYKPLEKLPPAAKLIRDQTNWYELYCGITRNWQTLKGLWNRRKIWRSMEGLMEALETNA